MEAMALLSYLSASNLGDGKWKGTTHAYILQWQDQVCKYHKLNLTKTLNDDIM